MNESSTRMRAGGGAWLAGLAYVLLGIVLTYPLITDLVTLIPGTGADATQFVWGIWHWKKILLQGGNPFFTQDLYYPLRVSLLMHTWSPIKTLLLVPLAWPFGETFAYNLGILLTFGLRGAGAFLMLRSFGADARAAFLGGLLFTFAPYQMAHGFGHFHTISNESMPWLIYVWRQTPVTRRQAWVRQAALVAWGLYLFFCDYQGFLLMLLLGAGYGAWLLWRRREAIWLFVKEAAPAALTTAALLAVFILAMTGEMRKFNLMALHAGGWGGAQYFVLDAASVFLPSELHPWWGGAVTRFMESWRLAGSTAMGGNIAERTSALGLTVLLVTALGWKTWWRNSSLRFWAWAALGFWVFTWGPVIRLLGWPLNTFPGLDRFVFDQIAVRFPAPYTLFHYLPMLNGFREPARFVLPVILAMTVLFGVSFQALQSRMKTRTGKNILFAVVGGLVLLEFWTAPYPMVTSGREMPAYDVIRQDPDLTRVVLDMPSSPWVKQARPFLFQTYHGHPLAGGNTSRLSRQQAEYRDRYAVLEDLMRAQPDLDKAQLRRAIAELSLGYLVCRDLAVSRLLTTLQPDVPGLAPVAPWNPAQPIQVWRTFANPSEP